MNSIHKSSLLHSYIPNYYILSPYQIVLRPKGVFVYFRKKDKKDFSEIEQSFQKSKGHFFGYLEIIFSEKPERTPSSPTLKVKISDY